MNIQYCTSKIGKNEYRHNHDFDHSQSDANIKDRTDWTLIFLWEFGKRYGLTVKQAFNYLKRYKGFSFIEKNYNYAHTQSFASMVSDMAEYCHRHGGALL